MEMAFFIVW